jgi:molybdate transport system substrate-binding protein
MGYGVTGRYKTRAAALVPKLMVAGSSLARLARISVNTAASGRLDPGLNPQRIGSREFCSVLLNRFRAALGAAAICFAASGLAISPTAARGDAITVSAANSLKDALPEIAKQYEADTGREVDFNFGTSGELEVEIQQGMPTDLFISAGVKQVDVLTAEKLVDGDSRAIVATNKMVLIVAKNQANPPAKFEELSDARFGHIAIGEPKMVACGFYAMEVLKSFHLDRAISDRLMVGADNQQVISWVSGGEADAGFVFATDAAGARDAVKVAAVAPEESHSPIVYPAVVIKGGHTADAEAFLQYLLGPKAQAALTARGFGAGATTQP